MTESWLPDEPMIWGEPDHNGVRNRWLSGAFGDRATISDIGPKVPFIVREDEWETDDDGNIWRTIKRVEVR